MPLHATEHEWLEDHVETAELVLVEFTPFVLRGVLDVLGEPFTEFIMRVEETRHDEVKERPQL